MCGILGAYARAGLLKDPEAFALALDRLKRRGPDDSGIWDDANVQLGHRRLAVVDLSPAGHQPMQSSDGRFVITYNGEIYDQDALRARLSPVGGWRGRSDTETLLEAYRAWGPDCLAQITGKFAFAVWDRTERRLFLARDRLGLKPLYYSGNEEKFLFASRPRALTRLLGPTLPEIDLEAVRMYLELGYIPAPLSFYRSIRKVPPGHYMLVDQQGARTFRYWDFRHIPVDHRMLLRPEGELAEELGELIRRAVRRRLVSDVPLGVFLSGGIDSATVAAAMKALGVTRPKAFTIGFRERAYDESDAAAALAGRLGVEHVQEVLDVDGLLQLLPQYVEEFDEPLADNSAFANMAVARLARRHVTVALTGDGGDELFGGYHYYGLMDRLARHTAWPPMVKNVLGRVMRHLPGHRAKLMAGAFSHLDDSVTLFNYMRSIAKDFAPLVRADVMRSTTGSANLFEQDAACFARDLTPAELGMRLDMGFMLPECYLQKIDLATMAFSLEGRCPLLDHELVEWAVRLPVSYKQRGGQTKYLLKQALSRTLPPELVNRPKRGFVVPVSQWLRGPLNAWARDLMNDSTILSRLPLERTRVLQLFDLHVKGGRDAYPLLWGVLMLLCFVSRHDRGSGLPEITHQRAA